MLESKFQVRLIKKIKRAYPGAIALKTDPSYIRSFPDLLILNGKGWAALETKRSFYANQQPNQQYYIDMLHDMSYGNFVHPENMMEVIDDLGHVL